MYIGVHVHNDFPDEFNIKKFIRTTQPVCANMYNSRATKTICFRERIYNEHTHTYNEFTLDTRLLRQSFPHILQQRTDNIRVLFFPSMYACDRSRVNEYARLSSVE